ncbi:chromosome 10 open reading frame 11 [Nesidiocoris tenuis]|uniref:Chromosome 10 open reading frame 11 n=1 Tax=Nesidiocoris tenuis TaxID=355587 RepID=A0ABN7A9I2_9HEMI|nr:chromosome 10 open reading frame 11 [Nesidiocoris tenuis]
MHTDPGPIIVDEHRLVYVSQNASYIPPTLYRHHGTKVTGLDLSDNALTHLNGLEKFTRLEELILDRNQLDDSLVLPTMNKLHTIFINNNKITNLELFLAKLKRNAPNVKYLSMLGNKACPTPWAHVDNDEDDYTRYRCYVLHCLPGLTFLDSSAVTPAEKEEAERRGHYMNIARPRYGPGIDPELSQINDKYNPLPPTFVKEKKRIYGKCNYSYNGLHSEGNRFIRNHDL